MANAANLAMIIKAQDEASPVLDKVSGNVEGFGQKVSGLGTAMSGALAGFGAGIGLAAFEGISSGISSIVSATMEAGNGVSELQAKLGMGAEAARALGEVAQTVFRNGFGESAAEVTDAIAKITNNVGQMGPEMTGTLTEAALTLSQVFKVPAEESSKVVGVMLKNFEGLSATDAFDLITAGFQQGGDYAGDLLDTLQEYAPQFAKLGLSAEQSMQMLMVGASEGGFNLDKLGDAVKEFSIRAIDGSKGTVAAYKDLGLNADATAAAIAKGGPSAQAAFSQVMTALEGIKDPLKQNEIGVALFGTQWEDLGPKALLAMNQGGAAMEGFQGATKRAADAMAQGIGPQLETLKRQLVGLGVDVLTPLLPHITAFATTMIGGIQGMLPILREVGLAIADVFNGLSPDALGEAADVLDAIFPPDVTDAVLGFVRQLGDAWRTVVQVFTEGWEPSAAVDPFVNAVGMMATAISAAITTVSALITILTGEWDQAATDAFGRLSELFGPAAAIMIITFATQASEAVGAVASFIVEQFGVVVSWVQENWPLIQETIQTVLTAIAAFWREHGDQIMTIVRAAWEIVKTVIGTGIANILDSIKMVMQIINGDWAGAWETAKGILQRTAEAFGTILSAAFDGMVALIDLATGGMLTSIGRWLSDTAESINRTWTFVKLFTKAAWDAVLAIFSEILPAIESALSAAWQSISDTLQGAWDGFTSTIQEALDGIQTAIRTVWEQIPEDIRQDLELIASTLVDRGRQWVENVKTTGQEMFTSITSKLAEIADAVTTWATTTVLDPIRGLVTSATSTALEVGSGIWTSITTKLDELVTAVTTWATSTFLTPIIGLALSTSNAMTTAGGGMLTAITTKLAEIVTAVTTFANDTFITPLRNLVGMARSEAGRIGQSIVDGIVGSINNGSQAIKNAAYNAARAAVDAAIAIIQPGSPSKVFTALGETIPQGLALGIFKLTPMVADAALAMAEAARQAAMAQSRPVISSMLGQLGATIGQGVSPAIRQFGQLASGSIVPGQIGGGGQYGLIPIGPGTIQPTTTTMQPYRADSYQEHDITVRVGDVEAARIYAVGKDLSVRIRGEG